MRARKIYLYLNPENPLHKSVLDYLMGSNLSTTEAIVAAVNAYQQGKQSENALIEVVRQTIKECFSGQKTLAALPTGSPQPVPHVVTDAAAPFFPPFKKPFSRAGRGKFTPPNPPTPHVVG